MTEVTVLPTSRSFEGTQDSKAPEVPFEYNKELDTFKQLKADFESEIQATKIRRDLRSNRKNVAELRQKGELLPDETIIPDRTIEMNCQTEIIQYIAFTEQPNQVLGFHDPQNTGFNFTLYADWITSLIRYENWQLPWQQMEDCMVLHGAGHHEVIFDEGANSKFATEYIRREHLIIPRDTKDIQACLRLARAYEITKHQLDLLAEAFSFNPDVVEKIKKHYATKSEFIKIYKYFLRDKDNYVYHAWFAEDNIGCDDWLREPVPHFLGDYDEPAVDPLTGIAQPPQPRPTTIYPIVTFPYRTQEDESILLVQGQAALSAHVQEAMTGVISGTVNACTRASGLFASRIPSPGQTPDNKTLYPLKSGYVHDGDMTFFSLPWPNPVALSVAQALGVRNASQLGNTDFAAMSRQDTAKRATEIVAAQEESAKIKTARIALFSARCLAEYKIIFNIILNQIKIGGIVCPLDPTPLFSPTLILTMAADTQVVKREQRKQKLLEFWPLVQTTALAPTYFEAMVSELFPEEWPVWKQAMDQLAQQQSAQANPAEVMKGLLSEAYSTMPPELQQKTEQTLNELSQPAAPNVAG